MEDAIEKPVKTVSKSASAPVKKTVPKQVHEAAPAPTTTTESRSLNPDGTEKKKKKKKKKPAPTYNLAKALAEGKEIPGVTDRPKPTVSKVPASAPAGPVKPKAKPSIPKPEEVCELPKPAPTPQLGAKKPGEAVAAKKEKVYHPSAKVPTSKFRQEELQREQQKRLQQLQQQGGQQVQQQQGGKKGLAGGALDTVGGAAQDGILTIDQVGSGLPVAGKAVHGATKGLGNTVGAATKGLGNTLDDTTGALGRGDIGGTLGGATKGVGNTVSGVGKGLVSQPQTKAMLAGLGPPQKPEQRQMPPLQRRCQQWLAGVS